MNNIFIITLSLYLVSFNVFSFPQKTTSNNEKSPSSHERENSQFNEFSQSYLNKKNDISCRHIKKENLKLSGKTEAEIKEEILHEKEILIQKINASQNMEEQKDLMIYHEYLVNLLGEKNLKIKLISSLEKICGIAHPPLKLMTKSLSLINAAALNLVLFPPSSVVNFLRGLLGNRQHSELSSRSGDFIYRVLGPKRGISSYLIGSISMYLPFYIIGANPLSYFLQASIITDMISNYYCHNLESVDKKDIPFCRKHHSIKKVVRNSQRKVFDLGKKYQRQIDLKIMNKRAKSDQEKICQLPKTKQVQRAKKALTRLETYTSLDESIIDKQILLPIDKNPCVKIIFFVDQKSEIEKIKEIYNEGIEGIEVITLQKNEYPSNYYFTDEELEKLSLSQKICRDQERKHFSKISFNKSSFYSNILKSALAPQMLSIPDIHEVPIDEKKISRGHLHQLSNIIFTIAPTEHSISELEDILLKRKQLVKQLKRVSKGLLKQKNYDKCLHYIKKKKMNLDEIISLSNMIKQIDLNKDLKKYQEFKAIKSSFKKVRKKLKKKWELISTNKTEEILSAVKSKKVGNIIIISHGKKSGFLVDSFQQEIPNSSFSSISPSLMSLNFYSCHSNKVIDRYDLKNKFSKNSSFYKTRYLTTVLENDFLDSNSFAPVVGFGDYLYMLDKHLDLASRGARDLQHFNIKKLSHLTYSPMCKIDLSNIQVKKGKYSVALNKNLITFIDERNIHGLFEFNCDYLMSGKNTLDIKNMKNSTTSQILNKENISLQIEGQEVSSDDAILKLNSFMKFVFEYET